MLLDEDEDVAGLDDDEEDESAVVVSCEALSMAAFSRVELLRFGAGAGAGWDTGGGGVDEFDGDEAESC